MAIVLDHTIVPAHDKEASARFLARILGLRYEGALSHFAPLRVNDTLTLDFDNDTNFESHHYAFKVDETEFDGIFDRVRAEGIAYGSGPGSPRCLLVSRSKRSAGRAAEPSRQAPRDECHGQRTAPQSAPRRSPRSLPSRAW